MTKKQTAPRQTKTENTACIIAGRLYVNSMIVCDVSDAQFARAIEGLKAIRVLSMNDFQTYTDFVNGVKLTVKIDYEFTMRSENRYGKIHWYAYRRALGKLNKRYMGYSESIDGDKIYDTARKLPTSR